MYFDSCLNPCLKKWSQSMIRYTCPDSSFQYKTPSFMAKLPVCLYRSPMYNTLGLREIDLSWLWCHISSNALGHYCVTMPGNTLLWLANSRWLGYNLLSTLTKRHVEGMCTCMLSYIKNKGKYTEINMLSFLYKNLTGSKTVASIPEHTKFWFRWNNACLNKMLSL